MRWPLVVLLLASPALADETEVSFAYVPAQGVEDVVVKQPLGRLSVRGWDRPEVRIAATKRAPDRAGLDRLRVRVDLKDGRLEVVTGVRVGEVLRPMPTDAGFIIDLAVDAPSNAKIRAATFDGDLDAIGFRAGVDLSSTGGEIHATDIDGPVRSIGTRGRQRLAAIRGDVELESLQGGIELDSIEGAVLHASVVDGKIEGRRIRARVVELIVARGDVTLSGAMPLGARWVLRAPAGDGRVTTDGAPVALVLHADRGLRNAAARGAAPTALSRDLRLSRPGSARLLEASVGGSFELIEMPAR